MQERGEEIETPGLQIWPLAGGNCSRTVTAWWFQTSSKCPSADALTTVVTSFGSRRAIKAPPERRRWPETFVQKQKFFVGSRVNPACFRR